MHAITVNQAGGPLTLQERPDPQPGPGALLVKVSAAGVNFIDHYHASGAYPLAMPTGLGLEGSGTVMALGEGVTDFAVGDRVAWCDQLGSYATHHVISARRALRVPDGLDDHSAAAAPLQGITAQFLTTDAYPVREGDDVLVHAAAGGVGQLLVQMVRNRGGRVLATVSTDAKEKIARDLGAAEVIRHDREEVAPRVRALTGGRGVHAVYDGVGKSTFDASLASLRIRGTLLVFGAASGQPEPVDVARLNAAGSVFLTRPSMFHYVIEEAELQARAEQVFGWIADGSLKLDIGGEYPLAQAAQAHDDLTGRRTSGKLLLIP